MPSSIVQIEGVGNVQFPDGMSDADIGQAAHRLYTGAAAKNIEANPPGVSKPNVQMQTARTGIFDQLESGPSDVPAMPNKVPSSIMNAPDSLGEAIGGLTLGGSAILAGAPGVGAIAKTGVGKNLILPAIGSYAINKARELPGVGPIISHIPYAEMLPWLFSGSKGKPEPETAPETILDGTQETKPYAGERTPPVTQSTPSTILSPIETAQPSRTAAPEFTGPRITPSTDAIRGEIEGQRPTADSLEDRGIQETMREDLEKHGQAADREARRRFIAGNSTGVTKSDLTGAAEKPVRYTKTPGVSAGGTASKAGNVVPGPDDDLTDLLQRSVAAAKKAQKP